MLLNIEHETYYTYDQRMAGCQQTLRLMPRPSGFQAVHNWQVTGPGVITPWQDHFGNHRHHLSFRGKAEKLTISARGQIETHAHDGIFRDDPAHGFPHDVYLRPGAYTQTSKALTKLAEAHRGAVAADAPAGLRALMSAIRQHVDFDTVDTHVTNTAAQALERGNGVCQDHAHIVIAICQILAIPARYVSGYLWTGNPDDVHPASHAWAEVWLEGEGWLNLDAANDTVANDNYMRLACGFDYGSAGPIHGIREGGGTETLSVAIRIFPATANPTAPPYEPERVSSPRSSPFQSQMAQQ